MPRRDVRMTAAEVAAFLARKRRAVVGSRDAHGAPEGEPAEFFFRDGIVAFTVEASGPTHRNLLADSRVVCSVEEFPSYDRIRGVAVHGRALLVCTTPNGVEFRVDAPRFDSFDFAKMAR